MADLDRTWYDRVPTVSYEGTGLESKFDPDNPHTQLLGPSPNTGALHHQQQMYDLEGRPLFPGAFYEGAQPGRLGLFRPAPPPNWRDLKPDWYNPDRLQRLDPSLPDYRDLLAAMSRG
jgi:hypothetical protein